MQNKYTGKLAMFLIMVIVLPGCSSLHRGSRTLVEHPKKIVKYPAYIGEAVGGIVGIPVTYAVMIPATLIVASLCPLNKDNDPRSYLHPFRDCIDTGTIIVGGIPWCAFGWWGVPKQEEKTIEDNTHHPTGDFNTIKRQAENGDAKAQAELGYEYQYGDGVAKDPQEACKWNLRSAQQGNPMAQHNLAVMFDEGFDIPQNKTEAAKWYQKAAAQGHPRAQLNLGVMYWKGEGVVKDLKRGWDLLNHVRLTSPSNKEKWAARRAMDAIKKEINSNLGPLAYPEWDIVQKSIRK